MSLSPHIHGTSNRVVNWMTSNDGEPGSEVGFAGLRGESSENLAPLEVTVCDSVPFGYPYLPK